MQELALSIIGGLTIAIACIGQLVEPRAAFPADSLKPSVAYGSELLESVCPGRVNDADEVRCKGACPEITGFPGDGFEWTLTHVNRGHFLSPASDDAVLSMSGCEPHSMNFGGTILLTRRSHGWSMLWYKPGVDTRQCHKVALRNRREILVCLGEYGGQGNIWKALYVEDLLTPTPSLMAGGDHFFQVFDNTLACGGEADDKTKPNPLTKAYIEKVLFGTRGRGESEIAVTFQTGARQMTPEDVLKCVDERNPTKPRSGDNFSPPTKRYQVTFVFDGQGYKPAR